MSQQVADTAFVRLLPLAGIDGHQRTVAIDEAHHNFHTSEGRYKPFADLLRRHHFIVSGSKRPFGAGSLKETKILVIANALHARNTGNWRQPVLSAFTDREISELNNWVKNGGSLFLIADHMPMAGAAAKLAASFGFTFYDCFAFDTTGKTSSDRFIRDNLQLRDHEVTKGIDSIFTFTGQAFDIPGKAVPILTLDAKFQLFLPQQAWVFDTTTVKLEGENRSQLALMKYGKGRLVMCGEAAMFTAQINNGQKTGMNSKEASQNYLLLLQLMRWLGD